MISQVYTGGESVGRLDWCVTTRTIQSSSKFA